MNINSGEISITQRLARAPVEDFNDAQAEAFADRIIETLNSAALALMISVGHRVKLFDVMARIDPATSEQIARAARLDERYVREWLGAMATCGVVEHYPANETYYLPSEHAASLTRAAAPVNIASTMQFIPVVGAVEDQIVACFLNGGAPPYSSHPRFQDALAGESDASVAPALVDSILPLVPGLAEAICTPGDSNEGVATAIFFRAKTST
jgi:Rv2258c-like winged HTH domain